MQDSGSDSLFERLGGAAAVDAAVDGFYDRVMADDRLRPFFAGTDLALQRRHQKMFLSFAFGGAPAYAGRGMRDAHRRLVESMGLADVHFDAVVGHLADTLAQLGVAPALIGEVAQVAESIRDEVLCR